MTDVPVHPAPHNESVEQQVIVDTILGSSWMNVAERVRPSDFYRAETAAIWRCVEAVIARGAPEAQAVGAEVEATCSGDTLSYLATILENGMTSGFPERYVEILLALSRDRGLYSAAERIARSVLKQVGTHDERMQNAQAEIFAATSGAVMTGTRSVSDVLRDLLSEWERIATAENDIVGVGTGLRCVDTALHGFRPGYLVIVAGRPGMGKTAFAMQVAWHAAIEQQKRVLVFSLEMSADDIVEREVSGRSRIPFEDIRSGIAATEAHDRTFEKLSAAMAAIRSATVVLDDRGGVTVDYIRSKVRSEDASGGVDLVVIDYLQLMSANKSGDNRNAELSTITRALKAMAKEHRIPVILLSQLNRAVETRTSKRPSLADLRDSGAIEQDADMVAFLYRESYYDPETPNDAIELIIAKHRHGKTRTILMTDDLTHMRMGNHSQDAVRTFREHAPVDPKRDWTNI